MQLCVMQRDLLTPSTMPTTVSTLTCNTRLLHFGQTPWIVIMMVPLVVSMPADWRSHDERLSASDAANGSGVASAWRRALNLLKVITYTAFVCLVAGDVR